MERLTKREFGGIVSKREEETGILCSSFCNGCSQGAGNCKYVKEMVEKLAEYEDLEEQGVLPELPCKVGDTVYTNASMQGWYFRKENRPYEAKIVFVGINGVDNFMNVDFENGRMLQFKFSEIGKTVFLTQAEAEKALKGPR